MSETMWWFAYWLTVDTSGQIVLGLWLVVPILLAWRTRKARYLGISAIGIIAAFWWIVLLLWNLWELRGYSG
jgi:hypothetical protein